MELKNSMDMSHNDRIVTLKLDKVSGTPKVVYGSLDCLGDKQLTIQYQLQQTYRGDKILASLNKNAQDDLVFLLKRWNESKSLAAAGYRFELEEKNSMFHMTTTYCVSVYATAY